MASAIAGFAQVAISNTNTTADAAAITADAAVTTADTAAGAAHTAAGTADAAAGAADATAGTTDAAAGVADGAAGAADAVAGTADTAASVADVAAAAGDVAAGVQGGIDPVADGVAAGLDTAGAIADTAAGLADTAAVVADGTAVGADATAVTADATAVTADATAVTAVGAAGGSDTAAATANATASTAYAAAATNHTAGAAADGISASSYVAAAASDGLTAQGYGAFAAGMNTPNTTGNNPNNIAYQNAVYGLAATESATHATAAASETAAAVANSVATHLNATAAALDTAAVSALAAATAANVAAISANSASGTADVAAGVADVAAGTADAVAGTADAAATIADAAAGALDAAAGIADTVAAAADAAAAIADTTAIALDITALATIEIPFVDIATGIAAGIADGVALGLDATATIADAATAVADGLATAADVTATTTDAAATVADTAATTADVTATTADTTATTADATATAADTAAANADGAAVAACKAADAGNEAADAADKVANNVNNVATVASLVSVGADIAFTAEVTQIQIVQTSVQTQSLGIADQLDAGIRSLDLRGSLVNDTINLNAGQDFTGATLQDAMNDMTSFLQANPTETLVVSLSANESAAINSPNGFNADLNTLLSSSDTSVPGTTYKDFIYSSSNSSTTPNLDDVRGKIVIIPSADNSWTPAPVAGMEIGWQPTQVTQDSHAITDPNVRWNYAENDNGANDTGLIPTDLGNPSTLYRNNLNQDNTAAASPVALGDSVDAIAEQYFGAVKVTRTTGIVGMDDPAGVMNGDVTATLTDGTVVDETLVNNIIDENNLPIIVTSSSDAPGDPGTLRAAIIQANSQPGVNSIEFADTLTGTTGNTIILSSDLPIVTNDLDVAGSAIITANGHQGLKAASTHNVTENNYVASDSGPVTQTTSIKSTPVYLNTSGLGTVTVNLAKATPIIVTVNPVNITYGTTLASSQLVGTTTFNNGAIFVSVPGTFIYKTAAGKLLHPGDGQSEAVTFIPTDTANFKSVSGTVTVNVAKATPTVTSINPVNIAPGTALDNAQLSGTATFNINGNSVSVYGTFTYNAVGVVLNAGGGQSQAVTFIPNDTTDYTTAQSTVIVNVAKPAPTAPQLSLNLVNITYGTALGNSQLGGVAIISGGGTFVSVTGAYTYKSAAGSVLNAGNGQLRDVTFTPDDTTDYLTAFGTVTVNVARATPIIVTVNPVNITYGTTLASSQLVGTTTFTIGGNPVSVLGTFSYTSATGSLLNAVNGQSETVTFTPTDTTDFTTASSATIVNVAKATPIVTGVNAVNIMYGTVLANGQLSGTATSISGGNAVPVVGTFSYTSAAGALLNIANGQSEAVTFTPNDTTDYTTASANVTVNVAKVIPTMTVTDAGGVYTGSPFPATGTAKGLAGIDLGTPTFTYFLSTDTTFAHGFAGAPTNAGSYVAVASVAASGNYDVGAAKTPFTITPAATGAAITSSASPAVYGQKIIYTATVTNTSGTGPVPVGAVQFVVDGVNSGLPVSLNASGQTVSAPVIFLTGTSHSVQAVYIPSPNFKSSSASLNQVVQLIAVEGTALFVGSNGAGSADQVQISPVGSSNTGSTGVQVQTHLNGVTTTTKYSQVFSAIQITLRNGNDTVQLSSTLILSAVVLAGNGNDNIQLAAGAANSVTLGNGNDQVTGGNGATTVVAGTGNDNVRLGNGNNQVTLGAAGIKSNDSVQLGNGNNVVTLLSTTGNAQVQAGNGANTINGAASNGSDTVLLGSGSNTVALGDGNDHVEIGGGNNDSVVVGNGNDRVEIGNGNNGSVVAGNGSDYVEMGNGNNDSIAAGNGNDSVEIGNGNNGSVVVGNGNDYVEIGNGSNEFVTAGNGNDRVQIGNGSNEIVTVGNGNDSVTLGNGSFDTVTIGTGLDDVRIGAGSNNTVHGSANIGHGTKITFGTGTNNLIK